MPIDKAQALAANRRRWDEMAALHLRGGFYDVDAFREGANTISALERAELGDVAGKSLVHLQCHFGLDTLSWARLGATVTGVDYSAVAIDAARALSAETGVPGRFVRSDVTRAHEALGGETFDVVYTAWGVLGWLPDLPAWAWAVGALLKPGGTFYIAEIHPVVWLFDPEVAPSNDACTVQTGDYFGYGRTLDLDGSTSYGAPGARLVNHREYSWLYELGQVITLLLDQGLRLEFVREHPFTCNAVLPGMVQREGVEGWWLPEGRPNLPLSFSIRARKPG